MSVKFAKSMRNIKDWLPKHFNADKKSSNGFHHENMSIKKLTPLNPTYSVEPPLRGGSNEYPQSIFWAEIWKNSEFLSESFHFLVVFRLLFLTMTNPNQMRKVLLFVCSKMADETNLSY